MTGTPTPELLRSALDAPYEHAVEHATAALKAEQFGVLTTIDVQVTLREKLGTDFRRYVILAV